MIFAKPPGGFEWAESNNARVQLETAFQVHPDLIPQWRAIRERLIHTGHKEGSRISVTGEANVFLLSVIEYDETPNLQIIYTILGSTLTVQSVRLLPKASKE